MKIKNHLLLFLFIIIFPTGLKAQITDSIAERNFTPYDLMSNYYSEKFRPFAKKNMYLGLDFSVSDKQMTNTDYLFQKVLDGQRLGFDISLRGGYFTGDYGMLGAGFDYSQTEFNGSILRDSDTLQSNSMTRGCAITPFFRSSVSLTPNERLSFYTRLGITFGISNTLKRDVKDLDIVNKSYSTDYYFRAGVSPGITFFAMENFAFEVQLNVLGYELKVTDKTVNDIENSRLVRQNVDFNIDILSLDLGLAYYFGAGKKL
ncbi:hypothetical protein OU798_14960 [Prolixibacteraceae bacterium Z1-6]|uniref:Outer membrane protein beta-barrel domain-containing protein n=1 Tax=Draconibacterium aestuarii TaxID=2998507 RepID=A0A9X3F6Z4_9BACT|nr:hypothetical protein [Prolixibacteraceae bacterium Z1-6]